MPKIIGQAEQEAAMKTIKGALKKMKGTNEFLDAANQSNEYTISFSDASGQTYSTLAISDRTEIEKMVKAYKQQVGREMEALAEKNRIELDQDEKVVLGIMVQSDATDPDNDQSDAATDDNE